jgi:hypothetical protein
VGTRTTLSIAAFSVALLAAESAFADTPLLNLTVKRGSTVAYATELTGDEPSPGFFVYDDIYEDPDAQWDLDYHWEYDSDTTLSPGTGGASAFATFGLTNNTGGFETFTVTAFVPLLQVLSDVSTAGDVEGSLADSNFDGSSLLTDSGKEIYGGLIDSTVWLTLMDDPFSFAAPPFGSDEFGPFAGAGAGPALADTDIGIEITFDLSPGDSVQFTANFIVEGMVVPAPGAVALLGLAGLAGTRRRRR